MTSKFTVERLKDAHQLTTIRDEWKKLESTARIRLPFHTWDWADCWWKHLHEESTGVRDKFYVHTIRDSQSNLVGVAPLMITERPGRGPLRMRHVQFFGADPNITELRGILAAEENQLMVYDALLEHLHGAAASEWDWMELSGMPQGEELASLTTRHFPEVRWSSQIMDYCLENLPATWPEFKTKLPRNIKESLRKCYNFPKRENRTLTLKIFEKPEEVAEAVDTFLALHEARSRLEDTVFHRNVFDAPNAKQFLLEICDRFATRKSLRVFAMQVDGNIAAMRIGFLMDDSLYLYFSGYDPTYRKYSVMTTTVAEAIQYAINKGLRTVNLSMGNDVSKTRWRPNEHPFEEALIVAPTKRAKWSHRGYTFIRENAETNPVNKLIRRVLGRRAK